MADMNDLIPFTFSHSKDETTRELPSFFEHYQQKDDRQKITEVLADWDNQSKRLRELYDRENAFDDEIDEYIKGKEPKEFANGDPEDDRLKKEKRDIISEIGAQYPEYIQELLAVSTSEQAQQQLKIFDAVKGDERQLNNFSFLVNLQDNISQGEYSSDGKKNIIAMKMRQSNTGQPQVMLEVRNLGGTGLDFALQDGRSILFAKDQELTENQISELSVFFEENGMEVDDFSCFKNLKITKEQGEKSEKSFQDIFEGQEYRGKTLEELRKIEYELRTSGKDVPAKLDQLIGQMTAEEEFGDLNQTTEVKGIEEAAAGRRQANRMYDQATGSASDSAGSAGDEPGDVSSGFKSILAGLNKEPDPSLKKMRQALKARAGIMRVDKKCVVERRMADGSICISFYKSESDMYADGKLDKDGVVQHKKMVSFRLYKNPPKVGIYVPVGAEFKTAYAKGALKALKSNGYKYFTMPGADEFGGDAQKAFWEAAGDQLMCPRLKSKEHPDGCNMGNDHLAVLLKAINDKNDGSEYEKLEFKMRLVEEIRGYLEYTSGGKPEKDNKPLHDSMDKLEGEVKFAKFKSAVLPTLKRFVVSGINGENPESNGRKWDQVDLGCAYKAMGNIATAINNGTLPIDYFTGSPDLVMQKFQQEMQKVKPEVEKTFKEHLGGNAETGDYGDVKESAIAGKCNNALAAIKEKMNLQFETIASCGAEEAKLEFKINDRGALTPKTTEISKGRYEIVSHPIPGVAGNTGGNNATGHVTRLVSRGS